VSPTERPFFAAQKLREQGLSDDAIYARLCADGHGSSEARMAVNALPPLGPAPKPRGDVELEKKAHGDRGYFLVLLGTLVLAAGLLLTLSGRAPLLGLGMLLLGLGVLGRGWWRWYLSAKV